MSKMLAIFTGTVWEAELLKTILEDNRIHCFITNKLQSASIYDPIKAYGVKVMIDEKDEAAAMLIVTDFYNNMKSN